MDASQTPRTGRRDVTPGSALFRALEGTRTGGGVRIGRYLVKERIGAGGMGVVYRAVDLERTEEVALKTLQRLTPSNLLRLKREFRSVADLSHENLVSLRELCSEGSDWFFTMELVQGTNLYSFVREDEILVPSSSGIRGKTRELEHSSDLPTTLLAPIEAESKASSDDPEKPTPAPEPLLGSGLERLRLVLPQVVRAVNVLHEAGMLHRDLKPANVLVDRFGRVVVLDFGLIGELDPTASEDAFCGTPGYSAPEQLHSPATAASDWYAVGVMIYEALTGRLPFRGDPITVLNMKQSMDPISPAALVDAPPDLDALAMALLSRDPAKRPNATEILSLLANIKPDEDRPSKLPRQASQQAPSLVGRDRELGQLYEALGDVRAGASTIVRVHGPSGIGKSSLIRAFCDEIESRGRALVLTGRCYERESVPYKALDPIVDALVRKIGSMSEGARTKLWAEAFSATSTDNDGASAEELVLAFPVLMGLGAKKRSKDQRPIREAAEQQRRAARALGSLLRCTAASDPLVLWCDDLQWGDRDSARLLAELLDARMANGDPVAPPLLWIGSFREDAEHESPFLAELFALGGPARSAGQTIDLPIGPLDAKEGRRLARARLLASGAAGASDASDSRADALVTASLGNPYFIEELLRYAASRPKEETAKLSIDDLIESRLQEQSAASRELLEIVAVAGGPIAQRIAIRAANVGTSEHAAVGALRAAQLVRTSGARPSDPIEPWHDRVRETVYARLDDKTRKARHLAVAEALTAEGDADAHRLATHFFHGGDRSRAARFAIEAAEGAARALAFDRAASLYQLAMDGLPDASERAAVELERRYADALVGAGRCAEAAPLYLAAAEQYETGPSPKPEKARELKRRAAETYLVSGRREEGIRVLRPLLDALGLKWPKTPRAAMISIVYAFLKLEIKGTRFKARAEADIDQQAIARADLCWSAGSGLLSVDSIRGGHFMVRCLEEALASGDRFRAARSLTIFALMQVYSGKPRSVAKGRKIFDQAEAISASMNEPILDGTLASCRGTADMSIGDWRRGLGGLEHGIEILKTRCVGVAWELGSTISSTFNARLWLGENLEIGRRAPAWHRDAEAVGDWFSVISAELYTAYALLSTGKTEEARTLADSAIARWKLDSEFTYQKWLHLKVIVLCELSEGRPEIALAKLEKAWPELARSGLLDVELMLQDAHLLRGTVLLSQPQEHLTKKLLAAVAKDAKKLEAVRRPTAHGGALLLSAGLATLRGEIAEACALYKEAAESFRSVDVALLASVADARRGALLGGDEGKALVTRAREHGDQERIGDFDHWVRIHAPIEGARSSSRS